MIRRSGSDLKSVTQMAWPEVRDIAKRTNTVLIPVAQVAQHGPHLPVSTDVIQAEEACRRTVERLRHLGNVILLGPTIPFGHSPTHRAFSGYLSLRPGTLTRVLFDIVESLTQQGFQRFVVFNVGGGNWAGLENAAFRIHRDLAAEIYLLGWFEMSPIWGPFLETHKPEIGEHDGHAGELETSCVLAVAPDLVDVSLAPRYHSAFYAEIDNLPFANMNMNEKCRAVGCWDLSVISANGMWGDATAATAEKGDKIFNAVAEALASHIRKYVLRV